MVKSFHLVSFHKVVAWLQLHVGQGPGQKCGTLGNLGTEKIAQKNPEHGTAVFIWLLWFLYSSMFSSRSELYLKTRNLVFFAQFFPFWDFQEFQPGPTRGVFHLSGNRTHENVLSLSKEPRRGCTFLKIKSNRTSILPDLNQLSFSSLEINYLHY